MAMMKKVIGIFLVFVMLLNNSAIALANTTSYVETGDISNVIVTDEGVEIDGIYYSQQDFENLLLSAEEVQTPQSRSGAAAGALVAGTWWIPGVGKVVVTIAGVVIVAGVVVKTGTWLHNKISNWFFLRGFNKSAENAVNNLNSNKRHHILNRKHNWHKHNRNPNWGNVAPILIKTLKEGSEAREYGNQYTRTLIYNGHTVVVRFIKNAKGLIEHIGTAWTK